MSAPHVRQSVDRVIERCTANPDDVRGPGTPVIAIMEDGPRCRANKPHGTAIISTDMPVLIGGGCSGPSPGLIFRASLASYDATLITLHAAQLNTLEARLEGDPKAFSTLGFLGIDESIPAGEPSLRLVFHIGAENATPERLRELIRWVEAHSPVGDSMCQASPTKFKVETV
ncbi:MAG: hypothetical protein ACK2T3_11825 [Candidatus Promineifilaceae bacterium]